MKQDRMEITCQPLTPLWTGNAEGVCNQIRETGLIGSLRWWYEAILRKCGIYACDPSKGGCLYEKKNGLGGICLACQLFGCTGWSRRFRLEVDGGAGAGELEEVKLQQPGTANHRGWRIPTDVSGEFKMRFFPLFDADWDTQGLSLTLHLIERYGAFGSKTSHGQGVVRFSRIPAGGGLAQWMESLKKKQHKQCAQPSGAPDLRDFVGVTVKLKPEKPRWWDGLGLSLDRFNISNGSTWIPSAPVVRAMLREQLRRKGWNDARHRLLGTVRPSAKGSDVFVTHLFRHDERWRMRIFGFVPTNGNQADRHMRDLLTGDALKAKLESALGSPVSAVEPYPSDIEALFS